MRIIKYNFKNYLYKIRSTDKYSALLYHLVHITVRINFMIYARLRLIKNI